jgi:hypothetical protein
MYKYTKIFVKFYIDDINIRQGLHLWSSATKPQSPTKEKPAAADPLSPPHNDTKSVTRKNSCRRHATTQKSAAVADLGRQRAMTQTHATTVDLSSPHKT